MVALFMDLVTIILRKGRVLCIGKGPYQFILMKPIFDSFKNSAVFAQYQPVLNLLFLKSCSKISVAVSSTHE